MSKRLFWILAAWLAWLGCDGVRGQEQQPLTAENANCRVYFSLSVASTGAQATPWLPTQNNPPAASAGTSLVIDNHQPGCYGWTVAYANHGFTAVSLSFQSAPDNAGGTAPGTWATVAVCGGVNCLGVNPLISTTSTITTTQAFAPWLRVNLTSKTGTGAVVGVLYGYKFNINAASGGGTGGTCPGGANTEVQYNSAGNCAGSATFAFNGTQVLMPDGTGAAPGWSFAADPSTGFYRIAPFAIGALDQTLKFTASGVSTYVYHDNDSWRCAEGDEAFQRGACEIWSFRLSTGERFWDLTDTFLSWGDPVGALGGTRVGVGRFASDGASSTVVHAATGDGGTHLTMEAKDFLSSGVAFASLGAPSNGDLIYCSDCTVTSGIDNTCAGSGGGAVAQRIAGAWKCSI